MDDVTSMSLVGSWMAITHPLDSDLNFIHQPIDSCNFLQKVRFLDILVTFRLDLSQITFNPVENAFATQQLAFLATSIAF